MVPLLVGCEINGIAAEWPANELSGFCGPNARKRIVDAQRFGRGHDAREVPSFEARNFDLRRSAPLHKRIDVCTGRARRGLQPDQRRGRVEHAAVGVMIL
jgi:hypothetical protein